MDSKKSFWKLSLGNTNTGNLVKIAMSKPKLFSKVLGLPKLERYIRDIDSLLVAVNAPHMVDVEKFQEKCDSILDYFHSDPDLSWNIT